MENLNEFLRDNRNDYDAAVTDLSIAGNDPFALFESWLKLALEAGNEEPHAMVLSTVNDYGRPSARVVLLRGTDPSGMAFYTNYQSRKANDLSNNSWAALTFYWPESMMQVRVEGAVTKLPNEESKAYFESRPRESQIGAWASLQSQPLAERKILDDKVLEYTKLFDGKDVPKPEHWGGYKLVPDYFEFWMGRPSRLHDRMEYSLGEDNIWHAERLYP